MTIELLGKDHIAPSRFLYVIIGARYNHQWLFVRHRDRGTWEMPAGHIEPGENPDDAANRELQEETGALTFALEYLMDYSVELHNNLEYGRLYYADIKQIGRIHDSEIAEIGLRDTLPDSLTYPQVQEVLFAEVRAHYSG